MLKKYKVLLKMTIKTLVPLIEHQMPGIVLIILNIICVQSSKQTYDMKINILQKRKPELGDFPDLTVSKDCALHQQVVVTWEGKVIEIWASWVSYKAGMLFTFAVTSQFGVVSTEVPKRQQSVREGENLCFIQPIWSECTGQNPRIEN